MGVYAMYKLDKYELESKNTGSWVKELESYDFNDKMNEFSMK